MRTDRTEYRVEQHEDVLSDGLTLMRRAIAREAKRAAEVAARRRENSDSDSANAGRFEPTPADAEVSVPL